MIEPCLRIAPGLDLPIDAVTQTFAILGKRGRGKTNTAVVLAEELIGTGLPVWIVDTVGAWWGLRSSADGKKPGLPVVVFGGDHADVPLEETAGVLIARVLIDKRIPAVIDTSGFSKAGARRFLTAFVTEIYHRNRTPVHVIFDEADELAPQRPGVDGIKLLGAMEDFVRRGRLRGLGCTLVTQRPAVLHKDVLTQAEVLVSMGMTGPRDVAAINEWVQLHADDGQAKLVRDSLASLPVGTAWVWSPEWLGILEKVKIRARRTFDSSATPKVGQARVVPQKRAEIDLQALGAEIAATAEKTKADDPNILRARIAELVRAAAKPQSVIVPEPVVQRIEIPVLTDEDRVLIHNLLKTIRDVSAVIEQRLLDTLPHRDLPRAPKPPSAPPTPVARVSVPTTPQRRVSEGEERARDVDGAPLTGPQIKVLTALATYGVRTHLQLAINTGYSQNSGSYRNTLGKLRSGGLIIGDRHGIEITAAGLQALGDFEPLPSGPALIAFWINQLPGPQGRIVDALLEVYPASLTHEALAQRLDYAPTSGSYRNSLGKLRTLELIHGGRDAITLSETLGEAQ